MREISVWKMILLTMMKRYPILWPLVLSVAGPLLKAVVNVGFLFARYVLSVVAASASGIRTETSRGFNWRWWDE